MMHRRGRRRKRRGTSVLLIIVFVIGVAVMLYPSIANLWNAQYQKNLIAGYETDVSEMALQEEISYEEELEKARAYNDDLWSAPNPEALAFLREEDPAPAYMDCLNVRGDGIMGYVSVPKIDIELPIYHTTDEESLLEGAGHLEGTSLPVGGESTHCVLAAHRGLPGVSLFTNLDQMEIGDHFFLHVLNEELAYEVDQIRVVQPDDISEIMIEDGKDLCTLLTCTPYGVNTERLLVRGHRVYLSEDEIDEQAGFTMTLERWLLLAGIIVAVVGTVILVRSGRKNRMKQQV